MKVRGDVGFRGVVVVGSANKVSGQCPPRARTFGANQRDSNLQPTDLTDCVQTKRLDTEITRPNSLHTTVSGLSTARASCA